MDRYKEGYADCNTEWEKKIQEKIKKINRRNKRNGRKRYWSRVHFRKRME